MNFPVLFTEHKEEEFLKTEVVQTASRPGTQAEKAVDFLNLCQARATSTCLGSPLNSLVFC